MTNGEKKQLALRVEEEVRAALRALGKAVSTGHPEIGAQIPLRMASTNLEDRLFTDMVLVRLKKAGAILYQRKQDGVIEYYMVAYPNFAKIPEGFEPVIFE